MNYNIPVAMEGFETKAIKEASCGFNKLKNINGCDFYHLTPQPGQPSGKIYDFALRNNTPGIFDFPQLLISCPARDVIHMDKFLIEWGFGRACILKYDWKLLLLINKLNRDVPYKQMITFAACLYKVLRKAKVFDMIAKSIVAYTLLQHKHWKPYVWMLTCCHEFEEIIKMHDIEHAVPLCLPFGKDRFSPLYLSMSFRLYNLPDSLSTLPFIKMLYENDRDDNIDRWAERSGEERWMEHLDSKWTEREQLISIFNLIDVNSFETVGNVKNITIQLSANHVGYCLLLHFNGHTNIDQFCLKMLYKNTNIDAISGKLKPILGCNGWYAITTDPTLTVDDIINLDKKLLQDVRYINFTVVDESSIVFSNSQSLDIIPPKEISIYWQFCNLIRDSGGVCGPYYV